VPVARNTIIETIASLREAKAQATVFVPGWLWRQTGGKNGDRHDIT